MTEILHFKYFFCTLVPLMNVYQQLLKSMKGLNNEKIDWIALKIFC